MAVADEVADRLLQAALVIADERGWRRLSLLDVAARAEVPLLDAYRAAPTKAALLCLLVVTADHAVLRDGPADAAESPRDRLFEVLMRRFDALQARRTGTVAILRDLPSDPLSLVCLLPRLETSFAWMLEGAGISSAGWIGALRVKALGAVYLHALRVWLDDDTQDMARTMAALDTGLRRAEQLARRLPAALHVGRPEMPPSSADASPSPGPAI